VKAHLWIAVIVATGLGCRTSGPKEPSAYLGRAVGPGGDTPAGTPSPANGKTALAPAAAPAVNVPPAQDDEAASKGPLETARRLWTDRQALRSSLASDLAGTVAADTAFAALTAKSLEARGSEPLFTTPDGASRALEALLDALRSAADHALSTPRHSPAALEAALADMKAASDAAAPLRADLDRAPAWAALKMLSFGRPAPTDVEVEGLDDAGRLNGLGRKEYAETIAAHSRVLQAEGAIGRARNRIEVLAQAAFFRWALDMKFRVVAEPFRADKDEPTAIADRGDALLLAFDAFAKDPVAGLAALPPKHPDYAILQERLAAYRKIAAAGPFTPVPVSGTMKLRRGSRGPIVEALKQRLTQEGYYGGPIDPVFDAGLEAAFQDYEATHGFETEGVVEERHAKSLNVPVEQRVRQIELGLQRWRESLVRPDEPLYVRVNLPEFAMAVWENGKMLTKHRIVCGNNNWDTDPGLRLEGRINRTKLFEAKIERVILNPRWYVPKRIQKLETDYELLKDPDYYGKHKFVVKTLADGREEIYQDSGDANALGRVKFVFPNPYGIYMHDTNSKSFFKREIRAFSHGCVRLQNPFQIMDLLLEKAAGISPENGRAILAKEELREIALKTPVPIFVEYNSVGVDEKGRVMFFSDVYGYDKDWFEGKIPYSPEELKLLTKKITRFD
jgi:murein L,D-transpeptidase YcbB/YkuD